VAVAVQAVVVVVVVVVNVAVDVPVVERVDDGCAAVPRSRASTAAAALAALLLLPFPASGAAVPVIFLTVAPLVLTVPIFVLMEINKVPTFVF
jgi:hypothetical protein